MPTCIIKKFKWVLKISNIRQILRVSDELNMPRTPTGQLFISMAIKLLINALVSFGEIPGNLKFSLGYIG
jgi:hypothetical protein